MKILLIGANGTIGRAVAGELKSRHEIVTAGRSHGDYTVDLTSLQSIRTLLKAPAQSMPLRTPRETPKSIEGAQTGAVYYIE